MIPLLHCKTGIGYQLLDKLQAIIYEHIACYSPGEEAIHALIPVIKNIIANTAKERNEWDESAEGGKQQGTLMQAVAVYFKQREMVLTNNNEQEELTHCINESTLKDLNVHCNRLVKKLRARRTLDDQQLKLKAIETAKGKTEYSVKTKMVKLLKNVCVELSSYHGGSLHGKDIKKVMNNSAHIFDELMVIMKEGKRPNSILSNTNVNALCLHFGEVFILWDRVFLLAQTVGPME
jgi:hypothetical protein